MSAPPMKVRNSRRRTASPQAEHRTHTYRHNEVPKFRDVRFGSKGDMCAANRYVRSTPNNDRESVIPQKSCLLYPWKRTCAAQLVMSAVGQKRTCLHPLAQLDFSLTSRRCMRSTSRPPLKDLDLILPHQRSAGSQPIYTDLDF